MKKYILLFFIILTGILWDAGIMTKTAAAKDADGDIVIIVDPGHGSDDPGACQNDLVEETLNWQIALTLKAELQTYQGVKVYLTRGSSEWASNSSRGRFGSNFDADLVVSLHNNSGAATEHGAEVYVTLSAQFHEEMEQLGTLIMQNLTGLGLYDRGCKTRPSTNDPTVDYYTLLSEATDAGIPSLLIEHCYLSDADDAAFMKQNGATLCGIADATAIAEYFNLTKRGVAGEDEITLIRTYSAYFVCDTLCNYSSSDPSVAVVSKEGVITAVSAGDAEILCITSDGMIEKVQVHVPKVEMVGIAAGINPTFYDDVAQYDPDDIMVKAVFSDGHVTQLDSGYAVDALRQVSEDVYDIPVSYGSYKTMLRIYGTGAAGSYTEDYEPGMNEDILCFPQIVYGMNDQIPVTTAEASAKVVEEESTELTASEPAAEEPSADPVTEKLSGPGVWIYFLSGLAIVIVISLGIFAWKMLRRR